MKSKSLFSWDAEVEYFDFPEDVQEYFLLGQCPALAFEIYKLTDWTIAMLSSQPVGSPDYMGHVFIIDSDAMAIDIKGRRTLDEVKDEWYFAGYLHRFFTLKEFEYEMIEWDTAVRFDRDTKAKLWAKRIVDILS